MWTSSTESAVDECAAKEEDNTEPDPPRNYTASQLAYFDGTADDKGCNKPVYLSLEGTVFDVSKGRDFYGPDGPYALFAGHECGVAMAKLSFDTKHLDDVEGCSKLNPGEKTELEGWVDKFLHYRCYPVMGKLVPASLIPSKDRVLTREELSKNDGSQPAPEGYAAAPIYLGAGDFVFDVSFGGVTFYGPEGSYHRFAGKDASRALALMSFDPGDLENTSVDDLDEKKRKTLDDWVKTFTERKGYPVVGRLGKSS
mmetsp:Transcript_5861/g.13029  ORF Transcript_5861/g.13029 Transcript_5861/m.13029 type:complete len:255 (+) Transcript_5861:198-962(+)